MSLWLKEVLDFLSNDAFKGLSFFLALFSLLVPRIVRKIADKRLRSRLLSCFWWAAPPFLLALIILFSYWQRVLEVLVLATVLLVLHIMREAEARKLMSLLDAAQTMYHEAQSSLERIRQQSAPDVVESIVRPRW